jgi:hypothetical protein
MTKRTRALIWIPLAAVVAVAVYAAVWLLQPISPINPHNAAKILTGMTRAEVEAVLGGPSREESTGPLAALETDDRAASDALVASFFVRSVSQSSLARYGFWASDAAMVSVWFDPAGHVSRLESLAVRRRPETPLEVIRRWWRSVF